MIRTKTFEETRYYQRLPGDTPEAWRLLSNDPPIDEQVAEWQSETGAHIVNVSAPGFSASWADEAMTVKCVMVGFVVIYNPIVESNQSNAHDSLPIRYDAAADANAADAYPVVE